MGYRLTDDPGDLDKWSYPTSHVLLPGEYQVVFASGNDEADLAGNPHTIFSLAASGEYLALSDPQGGILSEFGPGGTEYPALDADTSYGIAFNSAQSTVVTPGSSVQYLVPSTDVDDGVWYTEGFDDSAWQTGTASIGYESSGSDYANAGLLDTVVPSGTITVYVRIPFTVTESGSTLDTLRVKYDDGFIAYINGTRVDSANAPAVGAYDVASNWRASAASSGTPGVHVLLEGDYTWMEPLTKAITLCGGRLTDRPIPPPMATATALLTPPTTQSGATTWARCSLRR